VKSRAISLLGRDYTELGPLIQVSFPDGGALALSCGARRKAYHAVDPNEDAALLLRSERGALLAVADGFHGLTASHRALTAGRELRSASRTCLLLASIDASGCRWACLGDSALFRSTRSDPVTPCNDLVLQPGLRALPHPPDDWSGTFRLEPGERIAVVSDGVTNFVTDMTSIPRMLASAKSDAAAAREIALAALHGGAGDNVAVAALTLA
jgi:hypothetical protein